VLGVPAVLGAALLVVPLIALLVRAPWRGLPRILSDNEGLTALRLSVECATISTALCFLLGVPLAWVLARTQLPGLSLLRALVTVPLVLPPVVGGLALLLALSRFGVVGQYLQRWFGLGRFPFDTAGVVVAETFVALPFLVLTVEGALRAADAELEEAAITLGASRLGVFTRVTLPLVAPSLAAGGVLCWARALGEFGATITFAGSYPGITQTMPLAIYNAFESDPPAATALSLVLLAVAVVVLAALRGRWLYAGSTA
jgi:molybdate transport system permease protein